MGSCIILRNSIVIASSLARIRFLTVLRPMTKVRSRRMENQTGTRRHGRRLLVRDGGCLSLAVFGQASRDMRNPISGQHLGFIGLVRAIPLPDLLGTAFFRGFAILGSDSIRVDQLLSKARFTKNDCSNNP
jgi:hypothetical protein